MTGFPLKIVSISITACLCVFSFNSVAVAQKGGVRKPKKKLQKQEQPAPQLPAYKPAPLQPLPLDQVPALAPKVEFSNGDLTIVAHNSTLSDVLKEVREHTGAEFDIPPNANERVVADLGPGPARSVLAELLNGTHFNYVMVGSTSDPKAIQSIVLTPRTSGPDTPITATNRPGGPQGSFGQPAVINSAPADADNDGAEEADASAEDDAPQADQQNQQNPQNPQNNNNGQPATPKTPEQLLQELQRQQQQMQQQQNPQPGQNGQPGQPGQNSQTPPGILPNQPPTGAAPTPTKPE
jgi:hypothetical protein